MATVRYGQFNPVLVLTALIIAAVLGFVIYQFGFSGNSGPTVPRVSSTTNHSINTSISASDAELSGIANILEAATGISSLRSVDLDIEIVTGTAVGAALKVALPVTSATPGSVLSGDLNFTLGNLAVRTEQGRTTVNIALGEGLFVTGDSAPVGPPQGGSRWDTPFSWIDTNCTRAPSEDESRVPSRIEP